LSSVFLRFDKTLTVMLGPLEVTSRRLKSSSSDSSLSFREDSERRRRRSRRCRLLDRDRERDREMLRDFFRSSFSLVLNFVFRSINSCSWKIHSIGKNTRSLFP
jgi:hypothetical protein